MIFFLFIFNPLGGKTFFFLKNALICIQINTSGFSRSLIMNLCHFSNSKWIIFKKNYRCCRVASERIESQAPWQPTRTNFYGNLWPKKLLSISFYANPSIFKKKWNNDYDRIRDNRKNPVGSSIKFSTLNSLCGLLGKMSLLKKKLDMNKYYFDRILDLV